MKYNKEKIKLKYYKSKLVWWTAEKYSKERQ